VLRAPKGHWSAPEDLDHGPVTPAPSTTTSSTTSSPKSPSGILEKLSPYKLYIEVGFIGVLVVLVGIGIYAKRQMLTSFSCSVGGPTNIYDSEQIVRLIREDLELESEEE